MFKRIWKNLKSTLAGAAAGGELIVTGSKDKNVEQILTGVFVTILGLLAADKEEHPVTGVEVKTEVLLEK